MLSETRRRNKWGGKNGGKKGSGGVIRLFQKRGGDEFDGENVPYPFLFRVRREWKVEGGGGDPPGERGGAWGFRDFQGWRVIKGRKVVNLFNPRKRRGGGGISGGLLRGGRILHQQE